MRGLPLLQLAADGIHGTLGIDWSVLGIVLLGVAGLLLLIRVVGNLAARSIPSPIVKTQVPDFPNPDSGGEDAELTAELIAVLTAAATEVLGSPVRLTSVSIGKMAAQRSWSIEGRREIYMSHRIR